MAGVRTTLTLLLTSIILSVNVFLLLNHFDFLEPRNKSSILPSSNHWQWLLDSVTGSSGTTNEGFSGGSNGEYLIGVGKADITGPIVEINLMGYADPAQTGTGLRQRLYSRAFIVGSPKEPSERIVYLVLDTQSGDTAVRHGILDSLRAKGDEYSMYTKDNIAVTGTHSHSGPGAWLNYLLPQITSKGFNKQSYEAIVAGAVLSITRAHESLTHGTLSVATGEVEDGNINRSLYAYLANPEEERAEYEHSVDKTMTALLFRRASDKRSIGILTWFAVHGTSMLGNNTLITGDNKGVAADLLERALGSSLYTSTHTSEDFVAGFSQANVGDTSPNVLGAFCEDPELPPDTPCDFQTSLCNGKTQTCHGRGPFYGLDDGGTDSCFEIGRRQYLAAKSIFDSMLEQSPPANSATARQKKPKNVHGPVTSFHAFRDLSNFTFPLANGTLVTTCPAALGYSFAAGTTDGPGAFDFSQNDPGEPSANPLWAAVRNLIHKPSKAVQACHAPKPILLDVGETKKPYDWAPNVVDIQLLRIGNLLVIVSPGEATTMAGRRWRKAVQASATRAAAALPANETEAEKEEDSDIFVVLGGPANSYTHYIATREEYAIQRYEGASTLYGPHTLNAYIHLTTQLLPYLYNGSSSGGHGIDDRPDPGPQPPIHTNTSMSFINPVVFDSPGIDPNPFHKGPQFGDVVDEARGFYWRGESVHVKFRAANPRNDLRLQGSYVRVERRMKRHDDGEDGKGVETELRERKGDDGWQTHRDDANWDLTLSWERTSTTLGTSTATVTWVIPSYERLLYEYGDEMLAKEFWAKEQGEWEYRVIYHGDSKALGGSITPFVGKSRTFTIKDD